MTLPLRQFLGTCRSQVKRLQLRSQALRWNKVVQTLDFNCWEEDGAWLGYLNQYPDYWTQGDSLDDLLEHLKDLHADLSGGHIPGARRVGEMVIA